MENREGRKDDEGIILFFAISIWQQQRERAKERERDRDRGSLHVCNANETEREKEKESKGNNVHTHIGGTVERNGLTYPLQVTFYVLCSSCFLYIAKSIIAFVAKNSLNLCVLPLYARK